MPIHEQSLIRPENLKTHDQLVLDGVDVSGHWRTFIREQFRHRRREIDETALERLLDIAGLIPYDVQRIAHELWDHAELSGKARLGMEDVEEVVSHLVRGQAVAYERLWEQLAGRQRAVLQALAARGPEEIVSQRVRQDFRLGPASSVQKALESLQRQDILSAYQRACFFLDPLFEQWVRQGAR